MCKGGVGAAGVASVFKKQCVACKASILWDPPCGVKYRGFCSQCLFSSGRPSGHFPSPSLEQTKLVLAQLQQEPCAMTAFSFFFF